MHRPHAQSAHAALLTPLQRLEMLSAQAGSTLQRFRGGDRGGGGGGVGVGYSSATDRGISSSSTIGDTYRYGASSRIPNQRQYESMMHGATPRLSPNSQRLAVQLQAEPANVVASHVQRLKSKRLVHKSQKVIMHVRSGCVRSSQNLADDRSLRL